jgi:hypothetical protein
MVSFICLVQPVQSRGEALVLTEKEALCVLDPDWMFWSREKCFSTALI